jgi:hypothetical protein
VHGSSVVVPPVSMPPVLVSKKIKLLAKLFDLLPLRLKMAIHNASDLTCKR